MKPKVYDILMDVKKGLLNNEIIRVVTGDYGMNRFNLKLLEDRLAPYNLQNAIVRIMVVTPSGSKQQQDLIVENAIGGSANITLKQSLFSESGEYLAEFQIFDETTQVLRLTTPRFKYFAVESLQDDETILASDEYSILQQMIADVGDINNNINTKIETHNADEESHPHLIQQLNDVATALEGLSITRGYANPDGLISQQIGSANDLTETGIYRVSTIDGATNLPTNGVFTLEVIKVSFTAITQTATRMYVSGTIAGETFTRNLVSGEWLPWKQVATTDKINVLCTPKTGYMLIAQNNYQINNIVYYNITIKKTDSTAFSVGTSLNVAGIPSGKIKTSTTLSSIGLGNAWVGNVVALATADLSIMITCLNEGSHTVRVSGEVVL